MAFPTSPTEGDFHTENNINFVYLDGKWSTVIDGTGVPSFETEGATGPQGATGLQGATGPAGASETQQSSSSSSSGASNPTINADEVSIIGDMVFANIDREDQYFGVGDLAGSWVMTNLPAPNSTTASVAVTLGRLDNWNSTYTGMVYARATYSGSGTIWTMSIHDDSGNRLDSDSGSNNFTLRLAYSFHYRKA